MTSSRWARWGPWMPPKQLLCQPWNIEYDNTQWSPLPAAESTASCRVPCQVIGLKRALTWLQCFTRFKRFDIFRGKGICTINVQLCTLASSLSPCSFIRDTCRPRASRASPIDLIFLEKCQCRREGDMPCDAQNRALRTPCCNPKWRCTNSF